MQKIIALLAFIKESIVQPGNLPAWLQAFAALTAPRHQCLGVIARGRSREMAGYNNAPFEIDARQHEIRLSVSG